jgi:acetoin utilization deacetylase AcuC-like enzyme
LTVSLIVISSPHFVEHQTPPGHPEAPERADAMDVVAADWRHGGGEVVAPRAATHAQLLRVHAPAHVQRMEATAGRAVALDPDTYTSPETYGIALLAAGAAIDAVERVMGGPHRRALALVRPPGHHAEVDRAMGFCFFNNVAVAAAHARASGAARVAIVDYDVHHGNGTQHIFEEDPAVLYMSVHQFPYYPGTGAADEVGVGQGAGFTVNVPLMVGATGRDYQHVFEGVILPVLRQFEPQLVLVSAGFDAHERDPLGGMRLSTGAFAVMTAELGAVADRCSDGKLVLVTEGGYDLRALTESLRGVTSVLGGQVSGASWPTDPADESARGQAAVAAARDSLARYWTLPD